MFQGPLAVVSCRISRSLSKELISAAEIRVIVTIDFVTLSRDHILSLAFNNASDRHPWIGNGYRCS